jgi:hypothetical protein
MVCFSSLSARFLAKFFKDAFLDIGEMVAMDFQDKVKVNKNTAKPARGGMRANNLV